MGNVIERALCVVLAIGVGCTTRSDTRRVEVPLASAEARACAEACNEADQRYPCLQQCPDATEARGECDAEAPTDQLACEDRVSRRSAMSGTGIAIVVGVAVAAVAVIALAVGGQVRGE